MTLLVTVSENIPQATNKTFLYEITQELEAITHMMKSGTKD
jgi:hypothetical protein